MASGHACRPGVCGEQGKVEDETGRGQGPGNTPGLGRRASWSPCASGVASGERVSPQSLGFPPRGAEGRRPLRHRRCPVPHSLPEGPAWRRRGDVSAGPRALFRLRPFQLSDPQEGHALPRSLSFLVCQTDRVMTPSQDCCCYEMKIRHGSTRKTGPQSAD